jgi:peptidyl-dipeptidase Dcp
MFEKMQSLPLLQGLTLKEFSELIVNLKLDFQQYDEHEVIVNQGDRCSALTYIIDGTFEVEYHDERTAFIVSEQCDDCPHLIEAYNLFGVKRSYERTYSFVTKGHTFTISRDFFLKRLMGHELIRSNYINYLCNNLRKAKDTYKDDIPTEIDRKIVKAIANHCLFKGGQKNVRIKMNDLAQVIDETRLNVSGVLNQWKDQGLIELRRYGFTIKDFDKLTTICKNK